jgi:hypothetical protein
MGTARSQWELDRVVAHARNVAYVRGVVSYALVTPAVHVAAPPE